ncbi:hypothetical protein G7046_g3683 [Stylonectria norvegica]|nr:hypothetical protein G7046_g3683 [Stylonectria norvegica]
MAAEASTTFAPSNKFNNNLMSPPDVIMDNFNDNHSDHNRHELVNGLSSAKHPLPMSPPISPYSKAISTTEAPITPPAQVIKDPVLYPVEEGAPSSPPQPPLFAPAEIEIHRRIVDNHVRARSTSYFSHISPPRREEYEMTLHFRSQVMKLYAKDPKEWLRRERALLGADQRAGAQRRYVLPATPRNKHIAAKPARSQRTDRVSKPQAAPRPIRTHPGGTPGPTKPAVARVSVQPEPARRVVAPNREDKDFKALPNYCPPLDSLPTHRSNSLKMDWKGQAIDLGDDPHVALLHPDEVTLASNLRLDCATYLTTKRRIFERRLNCLRTGKEFRKTDAQQACNIDVNKASKLWTAFDKVGWLDAEWVRKYL